MEALQGKRICMLVMNDVSKDARVQKEAASLSAAGADVTVVGFADVESRQSPDGYIVHCVAAPAASTARLRPLRIAQNLLRGSAVRKRMKEATVAARPHAIHANDLNVLRQASSAAQRLRVPLVYDSHELWVEQGQSGWRKWYETWVENRLIRSAALVITVNEFIAEELAKRYGIATPAVIYNGPLECSVRPSEVHSPVRILFQGSFARDRNLNELVRSMLHLSDAELTLQGWGDAEDELRALVRTLGLEARVHFEEPCAPSEVVLHARKHDIGVINHKADCLNNHYSSPNKLFDYIGAGLAIAATDLPMTRQVVGKYGNGVVFEQQGPQATAAALSDMAADPAALGAMKAGSIEACQHYSWANQATSLVSLYERVFSERRGR